jgi:5-methylcytosine-specific restriction endonuclease McrA
MGLSPDLPAPALIALLLAVAAAVKLALLAFRQRHRRHRQAAYAAYLRSDGWRRLRREALERDGHRCRLCNSGLRLQVHHRYYPETLGTETADALTTLCGRCHDVVAHHGPAWHWR